MSHHYSGPDFGFPHGDARLDLTDLYAFPKPSEADKSILIMNVHPSAVVNPPGFTTREPFAPEALYELKIDTNGDAVADIAYRVRFSSSADGAQTATVRRVEGAQAAETGDSGQVIIEAAPVSTGRDARVTEAGRYRFFAGWRSDPFFFDTRGALNDLQFTGDDFFIDKDVCSIVLEMPNSALGPKRVGLWARTLDGAGGVWVQADRGALPAQAVFLVGSERDGYHAGEPANDARFIAVFAHALEHTGGYAPEEARRVAATLLPDMLSYDPTRPASFPSNGRTLADGAKPEGDRGQGRAPHRSACRVPLFGGAAQHLCAEPCNFANRHRASQGVEAPGLFMKEDVMNRLEKVLYTAKAHTTGGRAGMSRSSDGRLEVRLSRPGSPGTGTNPEQLFAAGWSACFESAMEFAARNMQITLPADHAVDAEIDLGPEGGGFSLAARLYVSLPGMERATAQRLVEATHQVCPYSRATHGNIAVETTLV